MENHYILVVKQPRSRLKGEIRKKSILLAGNSGDFGNFWAQLVLRGQMEMKHCLETSSPNKFHGKIKPTRKKKYTQTLKKKTTTKKPNKPKRPEKCEESVQTHS